MADYSDIKYNFDFAANTGALKHIKTITASTDSTISLVDGASDVVFDSTYAIYLIKLINIHPSGNQRVTWQCSTDGGSSYGVACVNSWSYSYHNFDGSSSQNNSFSSSGQDIPQDDAGYTDFQKLTSTIGSQNDQSCSGEIWLWRPSNTSTQKQFSSRIIGHYYDGSSEFTQEYYVGGYYNSTSAIDAMQFKMSSGTIDTGKIKLYGWTT